MKQKFFRNRGQAVVEYAGALVIAVLIVAGAIAAMSPNGITSIQTIYTTIMDSLDSLIASHVPN